MSRLSKLPLLVLLIWSLSASSEAEAQGPFGQGIAQQGNAAAGLAEKPQGWQLGLAMIQQALAQPAVVMPPAPVQAPVGLLQGLVAAQQGMAQGAALAQQGLAQRPPMPGALAGGPPQVKPGKVGGPPFGKVGPPFGKAKGKNK